MKISLNTLKKYWAICVSLGLIKSEGKHQQIIGWDQCIKILGLPYHKQRINKLLAKSPINEMTFNQVVNWLEQNLFLLNFKAQQYRIEQKQDQLKVYQALANDKHLWQANLRKIRASAKKEGMSLKNYAKRVLATHKDKIVTGSYHLSKKYHISQKKCNNLLNDMVKKNIITRTVIIKKWFQGEVNAATFDLAKELSGNALIIPSSKCFFQVVGSELSLLP